MSAETFPGGPAVGQVTLRYWAGARQAAGVAEEQVGVTGPTPVRRLVDEAVRRHAPGLRGVLDGCSVLVGDRPVSGEDRAEFVVEPGATVEFLPPFAGG